MNLISSPPLQDLESRYFGHARFGQYSIHWVNLITIVLVHAGALAAPFFFSWQGLAWMVGLYWFTGCVGITFCYHRLLTHRGFKLNPVPKAISHLAGALAMEGSALDWAMAHRVHHARSDHPGDPHSPLDGPWWSHFLWLMCRRNDSIKQELRAKYIPDLERDKMDCFFDRTYLVWNLLLGAGLLWFGGLSCFLWGFCLRVALVWHMTWMINSASHIWGYRNYETTDKSRNLWWVALFTFGEGWHNNHHAQPVAAYHGHRWWEIDTTGWVISVCKWVGLASDVRGPKEQGSVKSAA